MIYGKEILLQEDSPIIAYETVIIICEGETEREFCQNVLAPYLVHLNISIQAPLIKKSMGGIVR